MALGTSSQQILREGDTVVVCKLDRLARSTRDLLEIAETVKQAGAGLRSLSEPWADTTLPVFRGANQASEPVPDVIEQRVSWVMDPKAELQAETADLKEENEELQDQLDTIADIVAPADDDEDEGDGENGDDEEEDNDQD